MTAGRTAKKNTVCPRRVKRCFFVRNLWLITLGAFILRLAVSFELAAMNGGRNSVISPSRFTDLATYIDLSKQIAEGTYSGEFYYQPYYYAVFLPILRILFGGSPYVVIFFQSVAGALAAFFAGLTAKWLLNRTAGYWAAIFTAVSTPLLLYTPYCQNETLQAFHLSLLAYCCVRMVQGDKLRWTALAGLVLGISTLTRGNALLFFPGIMACLWWREPWRKFLLKSLPLFTACFIAVQIPFVIHNSREKGTLTGPSTAANAVLALGNTPEAPAGGRNPGLPAGPMEYPETWHDFMARAGERSVALQMWDYFCDKPAEFMELQFRKVLLFWDYREIPNNVSLYGEGEHSSVIRLLLPGRSGVLLTLALAGMIFHLFRIRRFKPETVLLYYLVVCYWLATALFYILSRFRAPIIPVAMVFAGMFTAEIWRARKHKIALYCGVCAVIFAIFTVINANDLYRDSLESAVMRLVRPHGTVYTLKDGRILHLDHGPFTGGGWDSVPIGKWQRLEKQFRNLPELCTAEMEWTLLCGTPGGYMEGTVNGKPFTITTDKPGMVTLKENITLRNGLIKFTINKVYGDFSILYDSHRNYNSGPELIIRIRRNL